MKATTEQKVANRRRMEKLGLWKKTAKMTSDQRASYVRGNLQVQLKLEK